MSIKRQCNQEMTSVGIDLMSVKSRLCMLEASSWECGCTFPLSMTDLLFF